MSRIRESPLKDCSWYPSEYQRIKKEILPTVAGDANEFQSNFRYVDKFNKRCAQGIGGLLRHRKSRAPIVFKVSKDLDYVIRHETGIMNDLSGLNDCCPHFCKLYKTIRYPVNDEYDDEEVNPFEPGRFKMDICLSQYVPNSVSLTKRLKHMEKHEIFGILKQVLLSLEMAQCHCQFTHYDLHTDNVLLDKTNFNTIFLYQINDKKYLVPTYGHVPVIIDYGFSHTKHTNERRLFPTMLHTDSGFLPTNFDPINDLKLLLIGLSYDLYDLSDEYKNFRRLICKIFDPLDVDLETGWDKNDDGSVFSTLEEKIIPIAKEYNKKSIWSTHTRNALEIIQSLVQLPLTVGDDTDFVTPFRSFIDEWLKIENELTRSYTKLYTLYVLIDMVAEKRPKSCQPLQDPKWIGHFRREFNAKIDKFVQYWQPPEDVDYVTLIGSLLLFATRLRTFYAKAIRKIANKKAASYDKMQVQSVLEFYSLLDANYPSPISKVFKANEEIEVWFWDYDHKKHQKHQITLSEKQYQKLNSLKVVKQGEYLSTLLPKIRTKVEEPLAEEKKQ